MMSEKRKATGKPKNRNFKRSKYGSGGPSKLEVGMKGILISHDRNKEKLCRMDSFHLLNHFADKLYGPEPSATQDHEEGSGPEDIESALASEINDVKTMATGKVQRRFSTVKSGCNNLIFVKCKEVMPGPLVRNIVNTISSCQDLDASRIPQTRNVLRMHPVHLTCPGYLDDISKTVPPFLEEELGKIGEFEEDKEKEFTIEYKCRNNDHLRRLDVIESVCEKMKDSKCGWSYNCRSKKVWVLIDVLKTICLVSVVQDYRAKRKYNIRELLLAKTSNLTEEPNGNSPDTPKEERDALTLVSSNDAGKNNSGDNQNSKTQTSSNDANGDEPGVSEEACDTMQDNANSIKDVGENDPGDSQSAKERAGGDVEANLPEKHSTTSIGNEIEAYGEGLEQTETITAVAVDD